MNILTKRNGIALIAVLTVLLVLTLLLPIMFTMSENAVNSATQGTDSQRAAYLSRTMIEMSVAAFEDIYDAAEDGDGAKENMLNKFYNNYKSMDSDVICMYRVTNVEYPKKPVRGDYASTEAFETAYTAYEAQLEIYENDGVVYSSLPSGKTKADAENGNISISQVFPVKYKDSEGNQYTVNATYIGYAWCEVSYNNAATYYSIDADGNTEIIDVDKYAGGVEDLEDKISNGVDASSQTQYVKIQNKNIIFVSHAVVNGKPGIRKCVLILPTKPAEENWITPASLDVGCNQIFPDTSLATGRTNINYEAGLFVSGAALKQPLYIFSCLGNMVISDEDLKITRTNANGLTETIPYYQYLRENNANYRQQDMSFGLHPETGTREPDQDPAFNCLRTYNMRSWAEDAQLDNFVAYTATNAIQVDLPVNLIINPCRGNRIGDGLDRNASLYKVLIFQAPTVIFNKGVASFVSLNEEDNAHRMTTIMLAAPKNSPYSYLNGSRKKSVKAGKVYFAEDAYIWLVPYGEDGSGYKTQTVYYKNKDIILYKIANAGDIYYYNSEIETTINGKKTNTAFSLSGYFMDVIYREQGDQLTKNKWWQVWSNAKLKLFNNLLENFSDPIYVKDDFKWIGNVRSGTGDTLPIVDDFYVVWES